MKTNRNSRIYPERHPVQPLWRAATLLLFLTGLFLSSVRPVLGASAAPGDYMTYQGFLVDATGAPLNTNAPANHQVVFRIYSAATGGSLLWSEQQVVTVDRGQFSVVLGEGSAVSGESRPPLSSVFTNNTASDRYIQITITINSTTTDILPRLRLVPSPYAFLSSSANKLINTNGATYVTYNTAVNRVEVTPNLLVSGVISGNGSGLTGLTASQIPSLNASNIGAGTLADARLSGNVALRSGGNAFTGTQTIGGGGNLGIGLGSPAFPLSFASAVGDKISLYGQSGVHYGFGMQAGLLQIHSDVVGSDIAFGYGSSAAFTETMRIKGNGNVGIGTTNPAARLQVAGNVAVSGGVTVGTNALNVAAAQDALRIIAGRVRQDGTIVTGSGFTVTKGPIGRYILNFSSAFTAVPVVTFTGIRNKAISFDINPELGPGNTSSCDTRLFMPDGTGKLVEVDAEFNFIAIGPR